MDDSASAEIPTLLGTRADATGAGRSSELELTAGMHIGRYRLAERIGSGGMGVVHAAWDPELGRRLALKLLHRVGAEHGTVREAIALARLAHPNVVTVHDVGTHAGHLWIAMELVDGVTLRELCRHARPPWPELLELLEQVGRGLAAAHAVGLVHRDVKPDNVMIGSDGRVRVMDFGLARTGESESVASEPSVPTRDARAGTPAYMAAEQHAGLAADVRTDVFAFCVTAWEALYGQRPFSGERLADLSVAVALGRVDAPSSGASVPGWLRAVLERGLLPDRAQRWPSMDALLEALRRGRRHAGRRRVLAAIAGAAALGLGVLAWHVADDARERAACTREGQQIDELWDTAMRTRIAAALHEAGGALGASAWANTEPWIDRGAARWAELRSGACIDELEHGDSPHLVHVRECLDERRIHMAAALELLASAEEGSVVRAPTFAVELLGVESCADASVDLRPPLPDDPAQRDVIHGVRRRLMSAQLADARGELALALERARAAHADAVALGWPPVVHEAGRAVGVYIGKAGDPLAGMPWLEDAAFGAIAEGEGELSARLAGSLAIAWSEHRGDLPTARRWGELALRTCSRLGLDDTLLAADLLGNIAFVERLEQRVADALAHDREALALREHLLGVEHPAVAASWNAIAADYQLVPDLEAALDASERALAIRRAALGEAHPDVVTSLVNTGTLYSGTGAQELARELFAEAVTMGERSLPPDHPLLLAVSFNLATTRYRDEDFEGARVLLEQVVAARERALGVDHPGIAEVLNNLAGVYVKLERCDDAIAAARRAVAIRELRGSESLGASLSALGTIAWSCGNASAAVLPFERALVLHDSRLVSTIAHDRFRLGVALWDSGTDPLRGRAFIEAAARDSTPAEDTHVQATRWLTEHPR